MADEDLKQLSEIDALSEEELDAWLGDETRRPLLENYFGAADYLRLRALAKKPRTKHFGTGKDIILLPGIMGSELTDETGLFGRIWLNRFGILAGDSFNALEIVENTSTRIIASGLLRKYYYYTQKQLEARNFRVHTFPFDWRNSIDESANRLAAFIEECSSGDGKRTFVLLAHSMGGLVSRRYFDLHEDDAARRVERLIMLGTPNHGSYAPPMAMTGQYSLLRTLGRVLGGDNTHRVVATFRGLYEMFPHPDEFKQPELYSRSFFLAGPMKEELLNQALAFQTTPKAIVPGKMIVIASQQHETVEKAERVELPGGVEFKFLSAIAGDGTVPIRSAALPKVPLYIAKSSHIDLPKDDNVLRFVEELLLEGFSTRLPKAAKHFAPPEDLKPVSHLRPAFEL